MVLEKTVINMHKYEVRLREGVLKVEMIKKLVKRISGKCEAS